MHKLPTYSVLNLITRIVFISVATVSMCQAQNLPNLHYRITALQENVEFKSIREMVLTTLTQREALTEQGAQQMTKHTFGFNGALEKVELLEAYTLKKSGQKIQLEPEGLTKQKGFVSSGVGITMPEWEVHQIAFPSLTLGDKTVIHTRKTITRPPLEGWLSYSDFLWPAAEVTNAKWRIIAPLNMPLSLRSTLQGSLDPRIADGLKTWEFEGSTKAKAIDQNPTNTRTSVPYLAASTIEKHEDIAMLFAQQVQAKAKPTEEIKSLSAQITKGYSDEQAKVKAIYDWVRRNIKYTAIYLANGGWEPHDTAHILKTKYGDCKDQVTLMYALLKEQGILAEPVLISTHNEFTLDPLPVAGSYNHTILYLPSLKKYLDPTASTLPYQGMSHSLHGRPVVRSNGLQSFIDKTPAIQPSDNSTSVHTTLTISIDGSAQMQIEHTMAGMSAIAAHDRLANYRREFEATEIQNLLAAAGFAGRGRFSPNPVNRDLLEQANSWNLTIRNFLTEPTAGSLTVHPGFNISTHISQIMGSYAQEKRDFGSPCIAFKASETFHVSFDPKFNILRVPKGLSIDQPGIRFQSMIQREGHVIMGSRSIEYTNDNVQCSTAEYSRRRTAMVEIAKHLRSPVLFMQPE